MSDYNVAYLFINSQLQSGPESGHESAFESSFTHLKRDVAHLLASAVMLTAHGSPGELCAAFSA